MSVLEDFRKEGETICLLQNSARVLGWDQQIMMPSTALATTVRGKQQATLRRLAHERIVADSFGELLKSVSDEVAGDPDSDDALALARWHRERARRTSVSPALVEELGMATAEAFAAWRKAKAASDFSLFAPHMENVFRLKREEAEQIGYEEHPYDAMLDEWEPGMKTATVKALFEELRPHLQKGVKLISESPVVQQLEDGPLDQEYPVQGQEEMARFLLSSIGFPLENRLDAGTHPFCSAASSHDVRLVTRYKPEDVATALLATLHEAGHGLYELWSPDRLEFTPLRGGCSLGVHESQSRLWENLVGRTREFWGWAYPHLLARFPRQAGGYDADDYYRAFNRVRPSLIRVEADEVTYSLHVILRFEIESSLMAGEIEVADVPELWNAKVKESLGIEVPEDAQGCLQDIHWSDGLVGYFPTYVLGNLIASDLWILVEKDLPEVRQQIARGQFQPLLDWLVENVYRHAARYQPEDLLKKVLGHGIRVQPFVSYLQTKFSPIYGVDWS